MSSILEDPKALATFLAALAAAITGIFSAFYSRRTQTKVTNRQGDLQTRLEGVKADLQVDIENMKDVLERARSRDILTRDRIVQRSDHAINSFTQLTTVTFLTGKEAWIRSEGLHSVELKVSAEIRSLQSDLQFLHLIEAIGHDQYQLCVSRCRMVEVAWDDVVGELTLWLNPEWRKEHPNAPEFSRAKFSKAWHILRDRVDEFAEALFKALGDIRMPIA